MTNPDELPVLYAEDDPDDRLLARMAHRESGAVNPLIFVADGNEALEFLRGTGRYASRAGAALPRIVLLDLNMPGVDGRETLRTIRADAALWHLPVVILTTSAAREDIAASYDGGANSYIVKPTAFRDLVQLFSRVCGSWFQIGSFASEVTR